MLKLQVAKVPTPAVMSQSSVSKPEQVPETANLESVSSGNVHENVEEASVDDECESALMYS